MKLYYVHESLFTETTSKVDVAGTSSMCDLQADHFTMVTSDMRACTIGLKRKKPTKTVKVEKSEEEKAAKAAAKAARLEKAGVLRKAKAYADKVAEMLLADKASAKSLEAKGYPASMGDFFMGGRCAR